VIYIGEPGSLPAGQPVTTPDLAEPIAEGPGLGMWVVAEELDDSTVDDNARCCPSVLPVGIGPFTHSYPVSRLLPMKAGFVALAPQGVA